MPGDANEFREAIPVQGSVNVDGPDSATSGDMGTASGMRGVLAAGSSDDPAFWYTFTRNVRDGVNVVTGVVLVSVWFVVHAEPNEFDENHAVWGPYDGDALDPVRWRLTANRVGEHHFEYILEGQKKSGGAGAPYLAVLTGDGYSRKSESHGDGAFTIDLDAARELDPSRHQGDSGTVRIDHDLPRDVGRRWNALPRIITASVRPATEETLDITSTAREDRTGELVVTALADGNSDPTLLENIVVTSRWRETGAGRADIAISGGNMPSEVDAVECWGTDFTRVYYTDSVDYAPSEGNAGDCAYDSL